MNEKVSFHPKIEIASKSNSNNCSFQEDPRCSLYLRQNQVKIYLTESLQQWS